MAFRLLHFLDLNGLDEAGSKGGTTQRLFRASQDNEKQVVSVCGRDWGQEEKGMTEDEMAGWHHGLDGCEFQNLCNSMDCSLPGSSVHGILQARKLALGSGRSPGVGNGNPLQYSWALPQQGLGAQART